MLAIEPPRKSGFAPADRRRQRYCTRSSAALSVGRREVPLREFDPTVGKLPPVFDHRHESSLRQLIEDFTGLQPGRVKRQLECLRLLRAGHPVCQIAGANEHVVPPKVARSNPAHHARGDLELKCGGMVQVCLSPLVTDVPMRKPASPPCRTMGHETDTAGLAGNVRSRGERKSDFRPLTLVFAPKADISWFDPLVLSARMRIIARLQSRRTLTGAR